MSSLAPYAVILGLVCSTLVVAADKAKEFGVNEISAPLCHALTDGHCRLD